MRSRLTYANVVSTVCLFIVLGGSAYAAATITGSDVENGSLTGADVKTNSLKGADIDGVRGPDISDNAIDSDEIEDHSIRAFDLAQDALAGIKGDKGDTGEAGPPGADGAKGDTGAIGPKGDTGAAGTSCLPSDPACVGPKGDTGDDATNLFAYIGDWSNMNAVVHYGNGVNSVSEPGADGFYTLTFNRDLANCVVHAVAGIGTPSSEFYDSVSSIPTIYMNSGRTGEITVRFLRPDGAGTDTSFLITAFC